MNAHWIAPLLVLLVARSAHATDSAGDATDASSAPRRDWYGWQTGLVDLASISVGATVVALSGKGSTGREAANIAGALTVTTFVLGAPTVHAAHRQWGKAGTSLALRLGAPTAGALAGFLAGTAACPHDERDVPCSAIGGAFGLFAGAATAMILDTAVIAYEPSREAARSVRVAPLLIAERDRWEAGVGGTF